MRGLAVGAVALTVAAVTAAATGPEGQRPAVLAAGAVVLLIAGAARARSAGWRTASATSAVVAGAALAILAARAALGIDEAGLMGFLAVAGAVVLVAGITTDERRLTALGIGQWAVAVALPGADAPFRHCLVATELALPVPRLDGLLVLGGGALLLGSAHRWAAWRVQAGRGTEVSGLLLVLGTLVAKGVELPGLRLLCGTGDATDAGWLVLALLAGLVATAYGLATGDPVWAAAGPVTLVAAGLAGTTLDADPVWSLAALLPIATALAWGELRGVPWPTGPGYRRRAPWVAPDRAHVTTDHGAGGGDG